MLFKMLFIQCTLRGVNGETRELSKKNKDMIFLGRRETCSICGKRGEIGRQRIEILSNNRLVDVYLECKDCAAIPLE
jgi:hypothetical protein